MKLFALKFVADLIPDLKHDVPTFGDITFGLIHFSQSKRVFPARIKKNETSRSPDEVGFIICLTPIKKAFPFPERLLWRITDSNR